jgi:hypothetical protein
MHGGINGICIGSENKIPLKWKRGKLLGIRVKANRRKEQ